MCTKGCIVGQEQKGCLEWSRCGGSWCFFEVKYKGVNAANLETGGANTTDRYPEWVEISEMPFEWRRGEQGLAIDIYFELVSVPSGKKVSAMLQSSGSRKFN